MPSADQSAAVGGHPATTTVGGPRVRRPSPADAVSGVLVAGLVGYAVAAMVPGTAALRGVLFTIVLAGTALSCGVAARGERQRPAGTAAWLLLAAAHLGVASAGVWSAITEGWQAGPPAGPAAVAYLGYYPPVLVASALLVRDRTPRWLPSMWWDAATVALGAGAAAIALLWALRPAAGFGAGSPMGLLAPVADAVLLTAILSVASLSGAGLGPGPWWVSAGLCVVAVADAVHLHAAGPFAGSRAVDVVWLTGYALVGLAPRAVASRARRPELAEPATERRHTTEEPGAGARRIARGAVLPMIVSGVATVVVAAALLGAPVPRPAALLGLASLAVALARSLTTWAWRRPAADDAHTDALTGLANRRALAQALTGDGEDSPSRGWSGWTDEVSLLLVDIDRFRDINEALGHETGDRVLAEVGARLQSVLREGQLLARLGGDEFAVLLPGADEPAGRRVAGLLRACLADPLDAVRTGASPTRLHVQASVGITTCQLRGGRPEDLLRQADVAVARAKATGTGVEVFDPERDRIDTTRLRRTDELRAALERGDLEVHLQPQVDLTTGAVVGAEALARWRHPQDGVLLPASFLPLAARTGLLHPVAALVLDRATTACARWWSLGHTVPVSVNLTADDLRDPDLPGLLEALLTRHGLPGSAVCVEITEDALLADPHAAAALLHRWRAAGVGVALDDFGTGYSSLAYLRDLPLDELKLDRAFVSDLRTRTTATIVRHTVAMAHALGLRVVGEGVEDAATARALVDAGCDLGQGLYFGDAMDLDGFLAHLDGRRG